MIIPCDNCKCDNWDSDRNGGHCMLAKPTKVIHPTKNMIICIDDTRISKDIYYHEIQKKTPR